MFYSRFDFLKNDYSMLYDFVILAENSIFTDPNNSNAKIRTIEENILKAILFKKGFYDYIKEDKTATLAMLLYRARDNGIISEAFHRRLDITKEYGNKSVHSFLNERMAAGEALDTIFEFLLHYVAEYGKLSLDSEYKSNIHKKDRDLIEKILSYHKVSGIATALDMEDIKKEHKTTSNFEEGAFETEEEYVDRIENSMTQVIGTAKLYTSSYEEGILILDYSLFQELLEILPSKPMLYIKTSKAALKKYSSCNCELHSNFKIKDKKIYVDVNRLYIKLDGKLLKVGCVNAERMPYEDIDMFRKRLAEAGSIKIGRAEIPDNNYNKSSNTYFLNLSSIPLSNTYINEKKDYWIDIDIKSAKALYEKSYMHSVYAKFDACIETGGKVLLNLELYIKFNRKRYILHTDSLEKKAVRFYDGKYGFINELLLKCCNTEFDELSRLGDSYLKARDNSGCKVLNLDLNIVGEKVELEIAADREIFKVKKERGNEVWIDGAAFKSTVLYDNVCEIGKDFLKTRTGDKFGIINMTTLEEIAPEFSSIRLFNNNCFRVSKLSDEYIISSSNERIGDIRGKYILLKASEGYQLLDEEGDSILEENFIQIKSISSTSFIGDTKNNSYIIDEDYGVFSLDEPLKILNSISVREVGNKFKIHIPTLSNGFVKVYYSVDKPEIEENIVLKTREFESKYQLFEAFNYDDGQVFAEIDNLKGKRVYILPVFELLTFTVIGKIQAVAGKCEVSNINAYLGKTKLYLDWNWPDCISEVQISYSNEGYPVSCYDRKAKHIRVSKELYMKKNQFILDSEDDKNYYITIYAVQRENGSCTISEGKSLVVNSRSNCSLEYYVKIKKGLSGSVKNVSLIISKQGDIGRLPELMLVEKKGYIPLNISDGNIVMSLKDLDFSGKSSISVEIPLEIAKRNTFVKMFFTDSRSSHAARLEPKDNDLLRLW